LAIVLAPLAPHRICAGILRAAHLDQCKSCRPVRSGNKVIRASAIFVGTRFHARCGSSRLATNRASRFSIFGRPGAFSGDGSDCVCERSLGSERCRFFGVDLSELAATALWFRCSVADLPRTDTDAQPNLASHCWRLFGLRRVGSSFCLVAARAWLRLAIFWSCRSQRATGRILYGGRNSGRRRLRDGCSFDKSNNAYRCSRPDDDSFVLDRLTGRCDCGDRGNHCWVRCLSAPEIDPKRFNRPSANSRRRVTLITLATTDGRVRS